MQCVDSDGLALTRKYFWSNQSPLWIGNLEMYWMKTREKDEVRDGPSVLTQGNTKPIVTKRKRDGKSKGL